MANEATWTDDLFPRINMIVEDNQAITKGTLLMLSGQRMVYPNASTDVFAGILAREKVAADGRTSVPVFTKGIFRLRAGGGSTISTGELVKLSGANIVEGDVVEADIIAGKVVGKWIDSAVTVGTAATGEVFVGQI